MHIKKLEEPKLKKAQELKSTKAEIADIKKQILTLTNEYQKDVMDRKRENREDDFKRWNDKE